MVKCSLFLMIILYHAMIGYSRNGPRRAVFYPPAVLVRNFLVAAEAYVCLKKEFSNDDGIEISVYDQYTLDMEIRSRVSPKNLASMPDRCRRTRGYARYYQSCPSRRLEGRHAVSP